MTALISSLESCCRTSQISIVWCWCEGGGTLFGAEVFMASTFVWAVGCSVRSTDAAWRFVDGCGWSVCGLDGYLSDGGDLLSSCLG
jgi:hypothetical protein